MAKPETNGSDLDNRRAELARLCRRKELRSATFSRTRPTRWAPTSVKSPLSGLPFTEAGAWEFIAEHLDSNHPLDVVILNQPPGKKGYVMIIPMDKPPPLYVKLQLGDGGKVIGRSFHLSDRQE